MRFVTWHWAFWACMSAVTVLALMPAMPHVPSTGSVLGLRAYPTRTVAVLTGLLAFGGLIELLQSLTPDRMAEWADWLADSLGLLLGWGLVLGWGVGGDKRQEMRRLQLKKSRYKSGLITAFLTLGGAGGTSSSRC